MNAVDRIIEDTAKLIDLARKDLAQSRRASRTIRTSLKRLAARRRRHGRAQNRRKRRR